MKLKQITVAATLAVGMIVAFSPEVKAQTYFDSYDAVQCEQCGFSSSNYFSLFGGWIDRNQASFDLDTAGPFLGEDSFGFDLDSDPGFGIGLALGRRISNNIRVEGEFVYRNQSLDGLVDGAGEFAGDFLGASPADVTAVTDTISTSINTYTLAGNVIYDFKRGSGFNPYVGGGLGVQFVGLRGTVSDLGGEEAEVDLNYPTVIYQWMAGVSKPLSQSSEVFVEYRGLGTFGTTANASLGPDSIRAATSLYQGSIFAGFRRNF